MTDNSQPIIIKKIKKGGHAHHGGAWKVAYADFVTAMMAFFLLMWLLGNTTEGERRAIQDFFQNPSAIQGKGGGGDTPVDLGGGMQMPKQSKVVISKDDFANKEFVPKQQEQEHIQLSNEFEKERLESLMEDLHKAIEASQALKPFKDQLLLDITPEGMRIQIVDKENRSMFDIGGATLKPYTREILHELVKFISSVPNRISITGHTDARPYSGLKSYSNWELSADRANACRRELIAGGMKEAKVARVIGLSSIVLFNKKDPLSPINRRISIIVMNQDTEKALMGEDNTHKIEISNIHTPNFKLIEPTQPIRK